MSLILEALKKSEQQRRLGEAPTLGSPVQAVRRRRSLLPLFGALAVIALGVGWWLARSPTVVPPTEAPAVAAQKPADAPVDGRGSVAAAGKKPPPHFTTPAAPAGPAAPHAAAAAKPGDAAAQSPLRNDRTAATSPAPVAVPARPLAAPVDAKPEAAKPAVAGANVQSPATAPAAATPAPAAPSNASPAASAASAAATTAMLNSAPAPNTAAPTPAVHSAAPAAAQPALPSVWELPYGTRKDIPELTLTMHVFASDPSQRFVVIKGERHVEGDDLGDGLVLKEIRSDGMVLDYKGQRFVYPRDGR